MPPWLINLTTSSGDSPAHGCLRSKLPIFRGQDKCFLPPREPALPSPRKTVFGCAETSALGVIKWKKKSRRCSFLFKARYQTLGSRWERRFLSSEKSFPGSRVKSLCAHPGVAPTQWLEWNFWLIFVVKQQKNKNC